MSSTPAAARISSLYAAAYAARGPVGRGFTRRRLLRMGGLAALAFAASVAAAVTVPSLLGFQSFTVLSGSMEPAIGTGDVIVVRKIDPLAARIGDVVTFRSPDDPAKMITHRVTRMSAGDGMVRFVTRGDANTGSERWTVPANGVIGRVEYRVPKLGYVTSQLGGRFGRLGLLVVPALLLAALELRRIWRSEPKEA